MLEPHPNECILATAGLDHDVKIWMATGEIFNDLEKLNKVYLEEGNSSNWGYQLCKLFVATISEKFYSEYFLVVT